MKYKSTILIVDDTKSARETLEDLLSPEGYNIELAENGKQALEKAGEIVPDLIMLDVMMPDMDGFEVCTKIRENHKLKDIPIIMITALDDRDSKLRGIEAGADEFLSKPFDKTELRLRVKTITKLNRFRKLHDEQSKFNWLVENSEDAYVIIDGDDVMLYANEKARFYFEFPDNLKNSKLKFLDHVKQSYNPEPQHVWEYWLEDNEMINLIPHYLIIPAKEDEKELYLKVEKHFMPSNDSTSVLLKITEATEKLNQNYEIWQFHNIISHKLKTPFNGILGSLQILNDEISNTDNDTLKQFSKLALESSNRYNDTISSILGLISDINTPFEEQRFHLEGFSEFVENISKNHEINKYEIWGLESVIDETLLVSDGGMEHILINILENAKKFHPHNNPKIEIEFSSLNDNKLKIEISDDGKSLSPNELLKIWQPYYQYEKKFTGEIKGTGLGLSQVALLMWKNGGTFKAYNNKSGKGLSIELIFKLSD